MTPLERLRAASLLSYSRAGFKLQSPRVRDGIASGPISPASRRPGSAGCPLSVDAPHGRAPAPSCKGAVPVGRVLLRRPPRARRPYQERRGRRRRHRRLSLDQSPSAATTSGSAAPQRSCQERFVWIASSSGQTGDLIRRLVQSRRMGDHNYAPKRETLSEARRRLLRKESARGKSWRASSGAVQQAFQAGTLYFAGGRTPREEGSNVERPRSTPSRRSASRGCH
jgi:hypothetical protein